MAETTPEASCARPESEVARVVWPVTFSVPAVARLPAESMVVDAVCPAAKVFAVRVPAKKLVEVALPSEILPLDVKFAAVSVVPLKVRLAESVRRPFVVVYGTLVAVR